MINISRIGKRIQSERKRKGLTLDELGEKINVSRQTLSKWERGEGTGPTVFDLVKLCGVFDCDYGFLVGEYECHRRQDTDINKEIGISESAIMSLREMNNQDENIKEAVFSLLDYLLDWSLLPSLAVRFKEYMEGSIDKKDLIAIDGAGNVVGLLPEDISYILLKAELDQFLSFAKAGRNTEISKKFVRDNIHKLSEEHRAEIISEMQNDVRRGK